MVLTARCLRGVVEGRKPRICSLGGVGYLGGVTTRPALAAAQKPHLLEIFDCAMQSDRS